MRTAVASAVDVGVAGVDRDYGYGLVHATAAMALPGVLEAKIEGPADGALVGSATTVSGVARGPGFVRYTLEYGEGATPAAWTLLDEGTAAVDGGSLGVFDPAPLPDGVATLRLTAIDASGMACVDRVQVVVDYVKISSPNPPHVPCVAAVHKPGTSISIAGTAMGRAFQRFRMEWAKGINPVAGWLDAGTTLAGGGAAPVADGPVGTWDTPTAAVADYYTIRLLVDNVGFTSEARTLVYLEPDLLTGNWPKRGRRATGARGTWRTSCW